MSFLTQITDRLAAQESSTAVVFGDQELTGKALLDRIAVFRISLVALGVSSGDRVALLASNSVDWIACDLAVLSEGAALVPLDPRQSSSERAALLIDARPSLLICERGLVDVGPAPCPQVSLASLGDGGPAPWTPPRETPADAVATLVYTSGSSGEPKGVVLTRANLTFMLSRTEQRLADLTGLPQGAERALHYLPLCYAGSRVLLLTCLLRGARLCVLADPKQLGAALADADADYMLNVPLVLERFQRAVTDAVNAKGVVPRRLLAEALGAYARHSSGRAGLRDRLVLSLAERILFRSVRARFGSRIKGVICGSAPLLPSTQNFFRMVGIEVYQGYGLTETTALCTLDVEGKILPGWVGPPLPGVEMRCSDGEIQTRGPHVFAGYWDRPEATSEAFTDDGWFRTGDLGEVDDQGRWRITGRRSALLVLQSGHNVAPEPLEVALRRVIGELDPSLSDAQVIALGHGQPHVVALVGPSGESPVPEAIVREALDRLNPTLSPKARIRGASVVPEAFSVENELLTANMKLRRGAIASRYADEVDALYAAGAPAQVGP